MPHYDVVAYLNTYGPSTPTQVARHFSISSIVASALLSSAAGSAAVRITHMKIGGGSPLYYVRQDSHKLQQFLDKLGAKERQIAEHLRQKSVIKDSTQTPVERVSLRSLRDFAIPFELLDSSTHDLYWRWYMIDENAAIALAHQRIQASRMSSLNVFPKLSPKGSPTFIDQNTHLQSTDALVQSTQQSQSSRQPLLPSQAPQSQTRSAPLLQKKAIITQLSPPTQPPSAIANTTLAKSNVASQQRSTQSLPQSSINSRLVNSINNKPITLSKPIAESPTLLHTTSTNYNSLHFSSHDGMSHSSAYIKELADSAVAEDIYMNTCKTPFDAKIKVFFAKKHIRILSYYARKGNTERLFKLRVPAAVGVALFLCKALSKKTINEGDVALAVVEAHNHNLPLLIIHSGKLTKKLIDLRSTLFVDANIEHVS